MVTNNSQEGRTGAKTMGPRIYPTKYMETTRIETSWSDPSVACILFNAPEGADDAKVEFKTIIRTFPVDNVTPDCCRHRYKPFPSFAPSFWIHGVIHIESNRPCPSIKFLRSGCPHLGHHPQSLHLSHPRQSFQQTHSASIAVP